jgi:alpha-L-fucosidase
MHITRRGALGALACAFARAQEAALPIEPGPFEGTREALARYRVPDWFRDAKFGIWAHWGPQSATEAGDWYARNMYVEGHAQYKFHLKHYGHPSKVGFKDVIVTFKGDRWDPEHLMDLYKNAGAKYFVSMGVHHDNFDMWDSKYQPRWNAATLGPKQDIVGLWKQAARKRGLRFGVSDHLSNSFDWFATSHGSDKSGPFAGVPYDGTDLANADLYHNYQDMPADFAQTAKAMGRVAPDSWKMQYFRRIKDLVDQHQPDLLYTDGGIPFEKYGLSLVAHHYNTSARVHGGVVEAVYTSKARADCETGTCALDLERGIVDQISPEPWQTDTCIGGWHYQKGIKYKTPKLVIDMLVDIVSRNGNLLLNFPLPGSGELDLEELRILASITDWMAVNSEGIYGTRPWKIYGTGPSTMPKAERPGESGFNESGRKDLTSQDVRFTTKGNTLFAFVMGWPGREATVAGLGTTRIENVELLGYPGKLTWKREEAGLRIQLPEQRPSDFAVVFKMAMA